VTRIILALGFSDLVGELFKALFLIADKSREPRRLMVAAFLRYRFLTIGLDVVFRSSPLFSLSPEPFYPALSLVFFPSRMKEI